MIASKKKWRGQEGIRAMRSATALDHATMLAQTKLDPRATLLVEQCGRGDLQSEGGSASMTDGPEWRAPTGV